MQITPQIHGVAVPLDIEPIRYPADGKPLYQVGNLLQDQMPLVDTLLRQLERGGVNAGTLISVVTQLPDESFPEKADWLQQATRINAESDREGTANLTSQVVENLRTQSRGSFAYYLSHRVQQLRYDSDPTVSRAARSAWLVDHRAMKVRYKLGPQTTVDVDLLSAKYRKGLHLVIPNTEEMAELGMPNFVDIDKAMDSEAACRTKASLIKLARIGLIAGLGITILLGKGFDIEVPYIGSNLTAAKWGLFAAALIPIAPIGLLGGVVQAGVTLIATRNVIQTLVQLRDLATIGLASYTGVALLTLSMRFWAQRHNLNEATIQYRGLNRLYQHWDRFGDALYNDYMTLVTGDYSHRDAGYDNPPNFDQLVTLANDILEKQDDLRCDPGVCHPLFDEKIIPICRRIAGLGERVEATPEPSAALIDRYDTFKQKLAGFSGPGQRAKLLEAARKDHPGKDFANGRHNLTSVQRQQRDEYNALGDMLNEINDLVTQTGRLKDSMQTLEEHLPQDAFIAGLEEGLDPVPLALANDAAKLVTERDYLGRLRALLSSPDTTREVIIAKLNEPGHPLLTSHLRKWKDRLQSGSSRAGIVQEIDPLRRSTSHHFGAIVAALENLQAAHPTHEQLGAQLEAMSGYKTRYDQHLSGWHSVHGAYRLDHTHYRLAVMMAEGAQLTELGRLGKGLIHPPEFYAHVFKAHFRDEQRAAIDLYETQVKRLLRAGTPLPDNITPHVFGTYLVTEGGSWSRDNNRIAAPDLDRALLISKDLRHMRQEDREQYEAEQLLRSGKVDWLRYQMSQLEAPYCLSAKLIAEAKRQRWGGWEKIVANRDRNNVTELRDTVLRKVGFSAHGFVQTTESRRLAAFAGDPTLSPLIKQWQRHPGFNVRDEVV